MFYRLCYKLVPWFWRSGNSSLSQIEWTRLCTLESDPLPPSWISYAGVLKIPGEYISFGIFNNCLKHSGTSLRHWWLSLYKFIYIYIYIYIYMEKISWTDHVRNEEVLFRVNEHRNILHELRKRKANWIGHILRRNCLLKQIIEGKIKGEMEVTRRRWRRRKKLLDRKSVV
jgi:hypothetical protein